MALALGRRLTSQVVFLLAASFCPPRLPRGESWAGTQVGARVRPARGRSSFWVVGVCFACSLGVGARPTDCLLLVLEVRT